jgi:hypothetical protein
VTPPPLFVPRANTFSPLMPLVDPDLGPTSSGGWWWLASSKCISGNGELLTFPA